MKKKVLIFLWVAIIILAAGYKTVLLLEDVFPFNSDEAIVGLMAKHILDGERPIFFYGQAYMGSMDAWLVAGGFAVFGEKIWVIRMVQTFLYLITVALSMYLVKLFSNSHWQPLLTGLFLAFPAVNMVLYTTVSLGGYGESLVIGSLLLVVYTLYKKQVPAGFKNLWMVFIIGYAAGLGFWINSITLVYSIPVIALLVWQWFMMPRSRTKFWFIIASLLSLLTGFFLGLFPWIMYVSGNSLQTIFAENLGKVVDVSGQSYFYSVLLHIRNLFLFGISVIFGLRPPWGAYILAKPILPFALAAWALIIFLSCKKQDDNAKGNLFQLICFVSTVLILGFIFTPFGNDPSGRYFLPLIQMVCIFAGFILGRHAYKPLLPAMAAIAIIGFNVWGVVESAGKYPPGLTTQFDEVAQIDHRYDEELIRFLKTSGEFAGYTNYWVAYPLAFQSNEELIYIPRLPYHLDFRFTGRDDRYQEYGSIVAESKKVAYITTNHPLLDNRIREGFHQNKVTWMEKKIGDYQVFYNLSTSINPEDLELGLIE